MNGVFGQIARNLLIPLPPILEFGDAPATIVRRKPDIRMDPYHPNRPFNSLSLS